MKTSVLIGLFGLLLLIGNLTHAATLSVDLPTESKQLTYPSPVRLDQVLSDTISHSKKTSLQIFPITNQLFNLDREAEATQKKHDVLQKLNRLRRTNGNNASIDVLLEQIKRWDVGYREQITLDFDTVRILPKANPQLSGNYELLVPGRPNYVSLEGLLLSPQQYPFEPSYAASDYLDKVLTLSSAHKSFVWLIYPDGHYLKTGFSYWNNEKLKLTPGSVIFLGFNKENKELHVLEEEIVKLIAMRKGL